MRMVVEGEGAEERATGELGMGMAEVKIWVLEAEMWVIVVVEVEVQVVVTYLVAAWAEAARKRRVRRIGWRILGGLGGSVRAKALVVRSAFCGWRLEVFVRARWECGFAQSGRLCDAMVWV